ncbi:hypothetical protein K7G98_03125 [Saccharothrix sp. MB29]|nr:hypothetical protein [Saccharothrix sp. MB29]
MPLMEPVDAEFFETAPERRTFVLDLPVSPERVWRGLTATNPLWWCRLMSSVEYTSPRPFGVGTTRQASVLGLLRLRERFFRWEGRRQTFTADGRTCRCSAGSARTTWWSPRAAVPVHLDVRLQARRARQPRRAVLNDRVFASLAADTRRHFRG